MDTLESGLILSIPFHTGLYGLGCSVLERKKRVYTTFTFVWANYRAISENNFRAFSLYLPGNKFLSGKKEIMKGEKRKSGSRQQISKRDRRVKATCWRESILYIFCWGLYSPFSHVGFCYVFYLSCVRVLTNISNNTIRFLSLQSIMVYQS